MRVRSRCRSVRPMRTPTFCALCVSRCGAIAVTVDGRFTALEPDREHPTGRALCVKGKAAPAIVNHADRLLYPLRRTAPKGADDPGWERISWDEALDTVAGRLRSIAAGSGPESAVFGSASPSTSALSDSVAWITRLRRAFGSPNYTNSMELCGWGRHLASTYTFGAAVPGAFMPDLERAGEVDRLGDALRTGERGMAGNVGDQLPDPTHRRLDVDALGYLHERFHRDPSPVDA